MPFCSVLKGVTGGSMEKTEEEYKLEYEEGEISDEEQASVAALEKSEKHKSLITTPNSLIELNLLPESPPELEPSSSMKNGWSWRQDPSSFPLQPDQFFQMAWQKGVQGSPKGSSAEEEEAPSAMEMPRESKTNQAKLSRSHSTVGSLRIRSSKGGNNNREMHRSLSWSSNPGIEAMLARAGGGRRKLGYLIDGDRRRSETSDSSRDERRDRKKLATTNRIRTLELSGNPDRSPFMKSTIEKACNVEPRKGTSKEERRLSHSCASNRGNGHREEGELEEGEIEGEFRLETGSVRNNLLPKGGGMKGKKHTEKSQQGQDKLVESFSKGGRERRLLRNYVRPRSRCELRGGIYQHPSTHRYMSESSVDEMLEKTGELLKNVTVKDAQRSFMGVCEQLRSAVKNLRELNRQCIQGRHAEGLPQKILTLSREAFSGIRAAYAVRNTATGKEQEQNKELFPRLLELACGSCQKLFTSKQIRELESMMGTPIGNRNDDELPKEAGSMRSEETDTKTGEPSSHDTAMVDDTNFSVGNDSDYPPILLISQGGGPGFGGQFPDSVQYAPLNCVASTGTMEFSNLLQQGLQSNDLDLQHEELAQNQSWPDHLDVVASYREKFACKSALTELPSPTPSEDENDEVQPCDDDLESSASASSKDAVVADTKQEGVAPTLSFRESETIIDGNVKVLPGRSIGVASEEKASRETELEVKIVGSSPTCSVVAPILRLQRGPLKPRDPRRRLLNPSVDNEPSSSDFSTEASGPSMAGQLSDGGSKNIEEVNREAPLSLHRPLSEANASQEETATKRMDIDDDEGLTNDSNICTKSTDGNLKRGSDSDALFGCSLSPNKRLKIDLNKPGEEELTMSAEELQNPGKGGDSGSDSIDSLTAEKVTEQVVVVGNSSKSSTVLEPPVVRMKPRDPRKVLLGAATERSENTELSKEGRLILLQSGNSAVSALSVSGDRGDAQSFLLHEKQNASVRCGVSERATCAVVASGNIKIIPSGPKPLTTGNQTLDLVPLKEVQMSSNRNSLKINECKNISEDSLISAKTEGALASRAPQGRQSENRRDAIDNIEPPYRKHLDSSKDWEKIEPFLQKLDEKQREAVRQERARRIEEQNRMLSSRKLCLVLDLDHTLLNSAKFTEIEGEWEARLRANEAAERSKFTKDEYERRELYRFPHMGMWTKLRPGIWNFLARASQLYELHVYTMGNKAYATEMAKLLDPTGALFAGRVISKGDDGDGVDSDERMPKSKDLDGVLGMESAVVIIDDSARVWPHHRNNLIVVERYMYFPCSRRQFGLPGPSLLDVGHDEREADGMLASVLAVIDRIHASFFAQKQLHEVDVREILASEQQRVLSGCRILFSRVFPQGESQPHLHPLWQAASQFGATCTTTTDEGVTHVVAISLGTDKVNWALATGRHVVRPAWLEASTILYRRVLEQDYPVSQ